MKKLKGKKVYVLGLGASGRAAVKLLVEKGADVWGSDLSEDTCLKNIVDELNKKFPFHFELGKHTKKFFSETQTVVVSPGIPEEALPLKWAMELKIPVISELELANHYNKTPIIAITGSNGKSTTTALIHEMLKAQGIASEVGGNFGIPFSELLLSGKSVDFYVLEVSSFQLENSPHFSPNIAVLTNLTPNHLDRYDSFEKYCREKGNIFNVQKSDTLAIIRKVDFETLQLMGCHFPKNIIFVDIHKRNMTSRVYISEGALWIDYGENNEKVCELSEICLEGEHNLENIFSAISAVLPAGVGCKAIKNVLVRFQGLSHRIELVKQVRGINYINDSKATSVDAVNQALKRFDSIHWIAGGRNKGCDFKELIPVVQKKVRHAVFIGEAREDLASIFEPFTDVEIADTLKEAINQASKSAQSGDVVLFSPGCSSFDMYENFEDRGEAFKKIVADL